MRSNLAYRIPQVITARAAAMSASNTAVVPQSLFTRFSPFASKIHSLFLMEASLLWYVLLVGGNERSR